MVDVCSGARLPSTIKARQALMYTGALCPSASCAQQASHVQLCLGPAGAASAALTVCSPLVLWCVVHRPQASLHLQLLQFPVVSAALGRARVPDQSLLSALGLERGFLQHAPHLLSEAIFPWNSPCRHAAQYLRTCGRPARRSLSTQHDGRATASRPKSS